MRRTDRRWQGANSSFLGRELIFPPTRPRSCWKISYLIFYLLLFFLSFVLLFFLSFYFFSIAPFVRFNTPDIMRGSANVLFSFPWALPQHFARCFARVCVFHKIIFKLTFIYFPLFRKFPGNISFITDGIMKIVTGSFNMITLFWMCLKLNIFFLRFFFSFFLVN